MRVSCPPVTAHLRCGASLMRQHLELLALRMLNEGTDEDYVIGSEGEQPLSMCYQQRSKRGKKLRAGINVIIYEAARVWAVRRR